MSSYNSGFFGSENFRENRIPETQRKRTPIGFDPNRLLDLSPERWVDIVCLSLIGLFLIIVACTWSTFSEALFTHILFPIVYVGVRILAVVSAIGVGIGLIYAKLRRRHFW